MIFVLLLSLAITYTILYLCFCIWRPYGRPPETKTLNARDSIRLLLDPPVTPIEELLRRRALPNQRLIRAFEIHNSTFTSASTDVHNRFRSHTIRRLRSLESAANWQTLREVIKDAVDLYLPNEPVSGDYATYMQAVVFVTVLAGLFDCTAPFPEASHVRFVTEGINALWTASKSPTFTPTSLTLAQINRHLNAWIPNNLADPFHDNPLEIILPAYETLWRLVAHAFTYIEGSPNHRRLFFDFFDNPTATQFAMPGSLGGPSALHIVQEVLRLHPPTKRIKRIQDEVSSIPTRIQRCLFGAAAFNCASAGDNTVAADIEALQQSSVWGPSPHDFDAMRHRAPTEAQKESFMPFGLGPLKCVASSLAPRLAGIIVAGVASRDDIELIRGRSQGGREGWKDWKIRRVNCKCKHWHKGKKICSEMNRMNAVP